MVNWWQYLACPTCKAAEGEACRNLNKTVWRRQDQYVIHPHSDRPKKK